ncbi:hypothetical protein TruAng_011703 [Truncatella angustata]|nr:hypothetical protein TruAng_011703 [Truncatella angustata]
MAFVTAIKMTGDGGKAQARPSLIITIKVQGLLKPRSFPGATQALATFLAKNTDDTLVTAGPEHTLTSKTTTSITKDSTGQTLTEACTQITSLSPLVIRKVVRYESHPMEASDSHKGPYTVYGQGGATWMGCDGTEVIE